MAPERLIERFTTDIAQLHRRTGDTLAYAYFVHWSAWLGRVAEARG